MSKTRSIQLHIPTPCHEDWQQMTPCEQGRFCGSCQKTVTDFSTWSDRGLYEFFSKNTAPVCGRFLNTQLEREIHIPYQPTSRLYRMVIACGLTLMFGQMQEAHARVKMSTEILMTEENDDKQTVSDSTGSITGTVKDDNGDPVIGAIIEVINDGIKKGGTVTDYDGNYTISQLRPGSYTLIARYVGIPTEKIEDIKVEEKRVEVDINFKPATFEIMMGYVAPLIVDRPLRNTRPEPNITTTPEQLMPTVQKIKTAPISPVKTEPKLNVKPKPDQ